MWNVPVHTCPCMQSTPRPTTCLHTMKLFSLLDLYVSQVSCGIFDSIILNICTNESLFSHVCKMQTYCNSSILGENKLSHCLIHYLIQWMFIEGQMCADLMNNEDIIRDTV